jgi:hypothetical protein
MPLAEPLVQCHVPRRSGASPPPSPVSIGQFLEFISLYGTDFQPTNLLDTAQQIQQNHTTLAASGITINPSVLDHVLQDFFQDATATFRSSEQREAFRVMIRLVNPRVWVGFWLVATCPRRILGWVRI